MDAALQFRPQHEDAVEDVAADFIEHEVGRLDWRNNWPKYKEKHPDYLQRIQAWTERIRLRCDPQAVVDHLNRLVVLQVGRWS